MTKRERLHKWLLAQGDWLYLNEIPHERFDMSKPSLNSALRDLCNHDLADFRIVGLKQYRAKTGVAPKPGPKPPKELK